MEQKYFDFEDAPVEDIDLSAAGDEVAYEDEQQEMFEHYRFDISAGQVQQMLISGPTHHISVVQRRLQVHS